MDAVNSMRSITTMAQHCNRCISGNWDRISTFVHALKPNRFAAAKTLSGTGLVRTLSNSYPNVVSSTAVERSDLGSVKRTVNRARVILALLLPGLWLAASANCLLEPVSGCGSNQLVSSISACGHAKHDASNSACSLEQSARRWSRRLNDQPGLVGPSTPVATSQVQLPQLEHIESFSGGSRSSFGLAQCWQFRWRTALEPRAPSSVS